MMTNNEYQKLDKKIQDLFNAIDVLLTAQTKDQQAITQAIQQSAELHRTIKTTIFHLSENIPNVIKGSAIESSDIISNTVSSKLQDLNDIAVETTNIFKSATRNLGIKIFGFGSSILLLCFMMMCLFIVFYVPSLENIEKRRVELANLEKSIETLELQRARAHITKCIVGNDKKLPCIRTNEREESKPWGDSNNGETYRLIWQGK